MIDLISKEVGEVIDNLDAALAVISEIADRYAEHSPQRQRDILKQMVKRVVIDPEGRIIRHPCGAEAAVQLPGYPGKGRAERQARQGFICWNEKNQQNGSVYAPQDWFASYHTK